jgi:nucleoside-diphosphate-sugar epimerase
MRNTIIIALSVLQSLLLTVNAFHSSSLQRPLLSEIQVTRRNDSRIQNIRCYTSTRATNKDITTTSSSTTTVLVIGGTSGIGQLVTKKLANDRSQNFIIRATCRNKLRGEEILIDHENDSSTNNNNNNNIEVVELDLLQNDTTQLQEVMKDVSVVVISVGTTAFPTIKWKGGNTPKAIDDIAVTRIANVAATIESIQKVILITSIGVTRTNEMPFLILNLFGVLDAKKSGENAIQQYSITTNRKYQSIIIRPGRLIGGPFTNMDVAKLLQIQGGTENGVTLENGDTLLGDCKRDACAECIVQCITNPIMINYEQQQQPQNNLEFSIISNELPALSTDDWSTTFQLLYQKL